MGPFAPLIWLVSCSDEPPQPMNEKIVAEQRDRTRDLYAQLVCFGVVRLGAARQQQQQQRQAASEPPS